MRVCAKMQHLLREMPILIIRISLLEHLGGLLGASWGPLESLLGASWSLSGASRGPLGALWGGPGAILGASFKLAKLSLHGVALECDWEATWSRLGVVLGPSWGRLGAILAPLGAVLGPPWVLLGPPLSHLRHLKMQCGKVATACNKYLFF